MESLLMLVVFVCGLILFALWVLFPLLVLLKLGEVRKELIESNRHLQSIRTNVFDATHQQEPEPVGSAAPDTDACQPES